MNQIALFLKAFLELLKLGKIFRKFFKKKKVGEKIEEAFENSDDDKLNDSFK